MKKTKIRKKQALPVAVSDCMPVYINGCIKYWKVRVGYDGNLAMNLDLVEAWRDIYRKNPTFFEQRPAYYDALHVVLQPNIVVPQMNRLTGYFKYNPEKNTSMLEYYWCDGVFNRGAKRAWDFRIKMLSQIQGRVK